MTTTKYPDLTINGNDKTKNLKKLTLEQICNLEFHSIANLFPLLGEAELDELARDIKDKGLKEPIVPYSVRVLDGCNRFLAWRKNGLGERDRWYPFGYLVAGGSVYLPEFDEDGHAAVPQAAATKEEAIAYVVAKNIMRRHLTNDQRAAIAAKLYAQLPQQAHGGDGKSNSASPASEYRSYLRTRMPAWSSHLSGYAALGSGDSFAESIVVPYFQSAGQIAMYRA